MNAMRRCLTIVVVLLVSYGISTAAQDMFLKIEGSKQGKFPDESGQQRGTQNCVGYQHEVKSPRDAASGLATGRRMHKPIIFIREIGKASPILMKAMTDNEVLTSVVMEVWEQSDTGVKPQLLYTITLTNARCVGVRQWSDVGSNGRTATSGAMEEVSFTYEKITWTWVSGGVTHEDSWSSSR